MVFRRPNSCTHFCPLKFDADDKCPIKCHYFNLIDFPVRKRKVENVKTSQKISSGRNQAQRQFFRIILKLNQCPTVIMEPKRAENEEQSIEVAPKIPQTQPLTPQQVQTPKSMF